MRGPEPAIRDDIFIGLQTRDYAPPIADRDLARDAGHLRSVHAHDEPFERIGTYPRVGVDAEDEIGGSAFERKVERAPLATIRLPEELEATPVVTSHKCRGLIESVVRRAVIDNDDLIIRIIEINQGAQRRGNRRRFLIRRNEDGHQRPSRWEIGPVCLQFAMDDERHRLNGAPPQQYKKAEPRQCDEPKRLQDLSAPQFRCSLVDVAKRHKSGQEHAEG
jgi:hypothetical protein